MITKIAADLNKKFTRECRNAVKTLLIIFSVNVDKVYSNPKLMNRTLEVFDYKLYCFVQSYATGTSKVYILHNKRNNELRGTSVRIMITSESAQVVTTDYKSREELNNAYSKTLIDYYLK
jgi:hypothetical protein